MKFKLLKGKGPEQSARNSLRKAESSELRVVPRDDHNWQDLLSHREEVAGFRIEVWRVAASRGTTRPKFYHLRFNLSLSRPAPARSSYQWDTVAQALSNARARAERLRYLIDQRRGVKRPKRRGRVKEVPLKAEPERLEALAYIADLCRHSDPLCPVCSQQVNVPRVERLIGAAY